MKQIGREGSCREAPATTQTPTVVVTVSTAVKEPDTAFTSTSAAIISSSEDTIQGGTFTAPIRDYPNHSRGNAHPDVLSLPPQTCRAREHPSNNTSWIHSRDGMGAEPIVVLTAPTGHLLGGEFGVAQNWETPWMC